MRDDQSREADAHGLVRVKQGLGRERRLGNGRGIGRDQFGGGGIHYFILLLGVFAIVLALFGRFAIRIGNTGGIATSAATAAATAAAIHQCACGLEQRQRKQRDSAGCIANPFLGGRCHDNAKVARGADLCKQSACAEVDRGRDRGEVRSNCHKKRRIESDGMEILQKANTYTHSPLRRRPFRAAAW
jgi:hypothetical protein